MTTIAQADATTRKAIPLFSGVLKYFPDALLAVAELSRIGNDQHNPGQPLHWSRGKSNDHLDCLTRHLVDAGTLDVDKVLHSTKVAWRALANLQEELENAAALKAAAPDRRLHRRRKTHSDIGIRLRLGTQRGERGHGVHRARGRRSTD